jgi:NDP-sugar pyrophosphorylase family protein
VNKITQAFVLAAGLGTRLRPLTDELPKPLIPIFQKPLVTFALDHLIGVGVNKFVINTHRHPELFQNFFAEREYNGCPVTLVHEPDLLETGGGIKNAENHFGREPFLTYSGDILTDVELRPLIEEHFRRGNDVTLACVTPVWLQLWLCAITVLWTSATATASREILILPISRFGTRRFSADSAAQKDLVYSDHCGLDRPRRQNRRRGNERRKWFNISSRAEYLEVHRTILRENWKPDFVKTREWPERKASSAIVDSSAQLRGCTVVGRNCRVGAEAILEDTILWPDAEIASQSRLEACIVRSRKKVTGIHRDIDI